MFIFQFSTLNIHLSTLHAQEVMVTVTPVQQVLPPQVFLYKVDPGKYFNVSITNLTDEVQDVYLCLQLEQVNPADGLSISIPPRRQPERPYSIPAKATYQLSMAEMQTMFNHVPSNEIQAPQDLFNDYANGSAGLLPEGMYSVRMTAYKWRIPQYANPQTASSPDGGMAFFNICYNGQPPKFLTPVNVGVGDDDLGVVPLDPLSPQFTWTAPVVPCNPGAINYSYNFRVVEMHPSQEPDQAINHNGVIYQASDLMAPLCIIPQQIIDKMDTRSMYVARVQAINKSTTSAFINYVSLENSGKSDLKVFRLKTSEGSEVQEDQAVQEEDIEEDEGGKGILGDITTEAILRKDSAYTYRLPRITAPEFDSLTARKSFVYEDIKVTWDGVYHLGGEGQRPDTLVFSYQVQLFNGGQVIDKAAALATKPIFTADITDDSDDTVLQQLIPWDDIEEKINIGDYLVLRVQPKCEGSSVAFAEDTINVVDFALAEHLAPKYFQCSSKVEITNTEPTTKSAKDLKDQVVHIGEYELTIDEIKGSGASGFTGKGRVEWRPLGFPAMVCVKFDKLLINTEDRVYEGKCESYADDASSDIEVVDKLFSDWGIDNLIGDSQLPAAQYLQPAATEGVKEIAKKINLSKYYSYIKTGKNVYDLIGKGKIERLYMPLALPKDINSSPVDIQIVGMTFAPDHATMNIMGQFTLPESDYLAGDILVLGAPRVCISPESILPEGGTVALLSDFTIKDPNSAFTMTFKAPKDLITPKDGCYVAWKDNKLEIFGIDMDMTIPGLVKDINGQPGTEAPKLTVTASVESWDEFLVDRISMDPFQVEDLPGWTFTAKDIVIDLAKKRNAEAMGAFPKGYDKKKAGIVGSDVVWQGCYINEISVKFPTALEIGTSGDRRFELTAKDMFFDKSGATLALDADQILDVAAEGKLGGWAFSLDNVGISILQNSFKDCHFSGTFGVPLVEGKIGYSCQIMKLERPTPDPSREGGEPSGLNEADIAQPLPSLTGGDGGGSFAYIFKTQQVDNLNFDFFLAKAEMNKKQTYLLVESVPEEGKQKTRVELMMGGVMDIGEASSGKPTSTDFSLPGIVFSQFRIANCKAWDSQFEGIAEMQKEARDKLKQVKVNGKTVNVKYYISNKEYEVKKDAVYISRGSWGLASPAKKLGPFEFTLNSFNFDYNNDLLKLSVDGKVAIVQGIDLSAQAKITIQAEVKNLNDFSNLSITYKKTELNDLAINSTFAGCTFVGKLHHETGENTGYSGNLDFSLPGDFLNIKADAAYYDYDDGKGKAFTWGFLKAKLGSSTGIEITPIKITSITGGFYFNCQRDFDDEKGAKPQEGLIGVVVGIGLSTTAGESALKGDFEMTCIYDKDNNRLTSFVFNGFLFAVDGMIDAFASLAYHNDDTDQYLALNVTVDAKADASELAGKIQEEADKFKGKIDALKEKGYKLVSDVTGGLADKIGDNDGETEGDKTDAKKPVEVKAGATVALNFRVTFKENGKQLSPVKWHLYLGSPESEQKRCRFTLIDFKSPVVSVNIGANAYLCVGNELPNDGKLPDIPYKVRQFLDGKSKGSGVQSASKSEADAARRKAMDEVLAAAASGCGVMLGATAYGYIDLDFGLLYGSFGATAGFDIALTKFKNPQWCSNYGSNMGFHDWYGNGQLYASLQADLGLRLNLGFFNDSISILKAGLGGCFKFQGPKPSYFMGEARCYLSLFNGLVDIDRTYEFECGTFCKAFHGNPLDDFELFGDCMGYENTSEGWDQDKAINPTLFQNPILRSNAPINQHFRILDENELDRIEEKTKDASRSQLETQASRTFVFKMNDYVEIRECNPYRDYKRYYLKGNISGVQHVIDLLQLSPNKNYDMRVRGWAKEIVGGKEVDPVTFNEKTHKYENKPWSQWKHYYFRTGSSKAIEDIVDLQEYVAIAYPSYYNQLKYDGYYLAAHRHDIQYPMIALTADLKDKVFQKGTLQWRWTTSDTESTRKALITKTTTDGTYCHVIAQSALSVKEKQYGVLRLEYILTRTVNNKIVRDTTTLASMKLQVWDDADWQSRVMTYEKPFVGMAPLEISYNGEERPSVSDQTLVKGKLVKTGSARDKNVELRLRDPYWYIAYLSNVVFVGGYSIDTYRFNSYVTTSQSLVYTDKGGKYEGKLSSLNSGWNCYYDYYKVRNLSWYQYDDYSSITPYPLPYYADHTYDYVRGGNSRLPYYYPSTTVSYRFTNLINDLSDVYNLCESFETSLNNKAYEMLKEYDKAVTPTEGISNVQAWNNKYLGCYITAVRNGKRLELPCYQLPLIWGGTWGHSYTANMYHSLTDLVQNRFNPNSKHPRAEKEYGEPLMYRLVSNKGQTRDKFWFTQDMQYSISRVKVKTYRVNGYDIDNGRYWVVPSIDGAKQDYCGTAEKLYHILNPLRGKYSCTITDAYGHEIK
ncbi:MAG: hypothetical protein IJT75_05100 [Bacteroidaceae bacterium]|nr:hypothetical protein [Bacteroidaceae bacterium]